jgi:iron complex transport system substrate-binding protein
MHLNTVFHLIPKSSFFIPFSFRSAILSCLNHRSLSFKLLVALSFICALGNGCTSRPAAQRQDANPDPGETAIYTDGIGNQVRIPKHPMRIISLAPNITETLYLLGAQDRLIGVTTQCHWPEAAKQKPKIGDLLNPNYEVILAARPDLVIASTAGNDRGAVMKLAGLGLTVYVASPRTVEKIFQSVEEIGRITDCAAQGNQLVAQMKERLETVRLRIQGQSLIRAFFITWFDPLLTPGKTTFENDVLRLAGVVSITSDIDQYYPRYSLEQLLVKDPDVILTIEHTGDPLPDFKKTSGWSDLRAVKEGKVYFLSEYLQHPSPMFVNGVEDLAKKLYPGRFR